jgi:hypothetical protein
MIPFEHFLLGLFPMIHLWQAFDPTFGIIFFLFSVLIDVDKYILVLWVTKFKVWDLEKIYKYFEYRHGKHQYHIDAIFIFHTIEFAAIILILYLTTHWIYLLAILFGWIYHMFFDILEVAYFKLRHNRQHKFKNMSIIWFLIRRKYNSLVK